MQFDRHILPAHEAAATVRALANGHPITATEVARHGGISRQAARKRLLSAERKGLLKWHGRGWEPRP